MDYHSTVTIRHETNPSFSLHWHDTMQIIYLLRGKAKFSLNGQQFLLHETDFAVINPFQLHNAELLGSSELLSFLLSSDISKQIADTSINCISYLQLTQQKNALYHIRSELANIFQLYFEDQSSENLDLLSHVYELLHLLHTHFKDPKNKSFPANIPRLSQIIQYLNVHYMEPIRLYDVAQNHYLSPNYLSQLFRDKLNMTFTDCLYHIRLSHGFYELCNTSKSITEIALDNGFPRVDTFIEKFRKKYSITPGKYRKGMTQINTIDSDLIPHSTSSLEHASGSRFYSLLKFSSLEYLASASNPLRPVVHHLNIPASAAAVPIHHDWKQIVNCGYADDCFTAEVQEQLSFVKSKIGFEYLRFHGILSDSMHVYDEDTYGNPIIHFTYIDLLLDRILSMGYKLYLEFSFIPSALASNTNYVYQNRSHISFPKDISKWCNLVRQFVIHCIERYGMQTVQQWKFSLFSISFSLYGFLSQKEYATLYQATYHAVKDISPNLDFCGPGFEGSHLLCEPNSACKDFLINCITNRCVPDVITFHSFPHSFDEINSDFNRIVHQNDRTAAFHLSSNEQFMSTVISQMNHILHELNLSHLPIMIDEWNSTIWQRDLCSDTCYKGTYVIKNMLETMDQTIGKAYWTVSDLINDWKPGDALLHGGHGMITYNGIPKPSFYAFQLLNYLGEQCLSSGDGWYITRDDGHVQILLYNYCHYNAMYRLLSEFHNPREPYSAFEAKAPTEFHINCSELFPNLHSFSLEYIRLGRSSGSVLDEYNHLGAPSVLSIDELQFLRTRTEPTRQISRVQSLDNICASIQPLESVLIIITPTPI